MYQRIDKEFEEFNPMINNMTSKSKELQSRRNNLIQEIEKITKNLVDQSKFRNIALKMYQKKNILNEIDEFKYDLNSIEKNLNKELKSKLDQIQMNLNEQEILESIKSFSLVFKSKSNQNMKNSGKFLKKQSTEHSSNYDDSNFLKNEQN